MLLKATETLTNHPNKSNTQSNIEVFEKYVSKWYR